MQGIPVDLAEAYRPRSMEELAGHELVKQLLSPRVEAGEPPQALLFSGPRGVGKTTTARLLAAGLNCEEGPSLSPCGQCRSCRAVAAGRHEFVREINAGAEGGMDTVRDLIVELRTPVPTGTWRVIVVDEGQGLTHQAQTAFLVPLEAPPARTVIVFCTTHPQGLSAPLRSRCEHVVFGALEPAAVRGRLEAVMAAEGFALKPETVEVIVSRADGCLRDALKLLGQARVNEGALEQYGAKQVEIWAAKTLRRLAEKDLAGALKDGRVLMQTAVALTGEASGALQALAESLYALQLVQQLGADAAQVQLGEEAWAALSKASKFCTQHQSERWVELVWEAWGRGRSALMRADALLGLTLIRMSSVPTSGPQPAAPAPVVSAKPETKPASVPTSGPGPGGQVTLEVLIAAADEDLAAVLGKAEMVSATGGELVLRSSSPVTRKRLKAQAGAILALAGGLTDLEVVSQ
jgi:DNA polymerase-3 subunit gamma/tau